jgi:hypothetical protein
MNNAPMMPLAQFENRPAYLRQVPSAILISVALIASAGCDKSDSKKKVSTSTATSAQAEPLPSVAPVAPPAPQDMDVAALEKDLNCAKTGPKVACRILKDFSQAQRFTAHTPSGEGRWVGNALVVVKGVESERELILWAKVVPTSQVGPGDLAIKVGFDFFPDDLKSHAEKLVRTISRGDQPSPKNQAFPFLKAFMPTKQRVIVNTAGQSVHVTAEESIYLRAKAPRSVYIVNPSTSREAAPGDGMYAELWLADW